MITRVSGRAVLLVLAAGVALGQAQPAAFEAVSLKMSSPQSGPSQTGGPVSSTPHQYSCTHCTLFDFLTIAYHAQPFQLSAHVPLDRESYDMAAKLPPGTTVDQFRAMMRNLLAERFHLKLHIEPHDFPAYELQAVKNGVKLRESSDALPAVKDGFPAPPSYGGISRRFSTVEGYVLTRLSARQTTMAVLARWLSLPNEPPVVDKTGLTGQYDFTLEYTREAPGSPPEAGAAPPSIPDMAAAVRQQLGLQLISRRLPFEVFVIDAVDLRPVEN